MQPFLLYYIYENVYFHQYWKSYEFIFVQVGLTIAAVPVRKNGN